MSHELRTPLAAILGYAELMQQGFYEPLGQKSLDALTRIRSNGKHLLGLINTVLDIAKIESGTADGPRLVDWGGAVRAPAALDLACCHILLSEIAPEVVDNPQRPRAVNAAAQSEYARLAGMSHAALTAAMEPYLPIVRVRVLLGGWGASAQRERLIQRIEEALCSGIDYSQPRGRECCPARSESCRHIIIGT